MVRAIKQRAVEQWEEKRPPSGLTRQGILPKTPSLVADNPAYHFVMMIFLSGQVVVRLFQGRWDRRNMMECLICAGPSSFMPALMTNLFAGMIFTLQSAREMMNYGMVNAVGSAFAVAYCRELAPILTAAVLACQAGSAFAAEIACMKLTEQIDALKVLRTDPIDYLVMPRVLACAVMLPVLTLCGLFVGVAGGLFIANHFYDVTTLNFLDGIRESITITDIVAVLVKAMLFGGAIAVTSCSRGLTATCHGRGVGQSATSAVVTAWVMLFVLDFLLSVLLLNVGGSHAPMM
jgi:phospholipid/cholesterol/gamma-HCH transport system permease protein